MLLARRQLARKISAAAAAGDMQGISGGAPSPGIPPAAAAAYANPAPYMMWNPYTGHQGAAGPLLPTAGLGIGPGSMPPLLQQPNVYGQLPSQHLRCGISDEGDISISYVFRESGLGAA